MSDASYSATFTVAQSPATAFDAVLDPRGWWSHEVTGESREIGDVFHFHDEGITSSSFRLVESVPGRRVVWHIDDAYLSFVEDHDEWTGTRIIFEIEPAGDGSTVRFTHEGLVNSVECFSACSNGWGMCMDSLKELIEKRA